MNISSEVLQYTSNLDRVYSVGTNNHEHHSNNPDYIGILLQPIVSNPSSWAGKNALDFGCGKGRNVDTMLYYSKWNSVDGVDISRSNIDYCRTLNRGNSLYYKNNGKDLADLKSDHYDFVMSTIVFQHISMYDLRKLLFGEIYRVMKVGGVFSFQMGYGNTLSSKNSVSYFSNVVSESSNGNCDVVVSSENEIIHDLSSIGFKDISTKIANSWSDDNHKLWIYVTCKK